MPSPKDILGQISAGRVLDVATGGGGFVHFLLEGLDDYAASAPRGIPICKRAARSYVNAWRRWGSIPRRRW